MQFIFSKKLVRYYSFIFFSITIFNTARAQSFPLPKDWKFKMEDDMGWADSSFNDNDWGIRQIGKGWSATGMKDNVYAWYRIKIIIPSSMKSAEKGKGIKLNLGKIDDVDQTFFNGKLIGQTGSLPPSYESKWDADRVYIIPDSIINWDKDNVIAVRVFSLDAGGVGMYEGPYNYGPIQWSDSVSIEYSIIETDHHGFITKMKFINNGNSAFLNTVKYWIADKNYKELFSQIKQVQIMPEKGSVAEIAFSIYQPLHEKIFKVGFVVTGINSKDTVRNEQVYLANKDIDIPLAAEPNPVIENKVKDAYINIPFQNQNLEGYIGTRFTQNLEERLLKIDENRIMSGYLQRPGSHPWIGEHIGKYLEAACNTWKVTHNPGLKKQMDRMMYELINSQLKNGYLGTY